MADFVEDFFKSTDHHTDCKWCGRISIASCGKVQKRKAKEVLDKCRGGGKVSYNEILLDQTHNSCASCNHFTWRTRNETVEEYIE